MAYNMKIYRKTITAGKLVLIVEYTRPGPNDSKKERAAKRALTTAAQKKLNFKNACRKLEFKLAANFKPGADYFVTLTYENNSLPYSRRAAVKDNCGFIRRLRDQRRKRGQVLKWISATEEKHGDGRLHHHLIINAADPSIDIDEIKSLWPYGHVKVTRLFDREHKTETWASIARYLTKERPDAGADPTPVGWQIYRCSRNLVNPLTDPRFYKTEWVNENSPIPEPPKVYEREEERQINEYGRFYYLKYLTEPLYREE